ncbi:1624_t:CDS:2, partial [Funneliformis caledonium]
VLKKNRGATDDKIIKAYKKKQASAFSKSQLMVKVRKTLSVSYVCLRKEDSGGYPPCYPIADILARQRRLNDGIRRNVDMIKDTMEAKMKEIIVQLPSETANANDPSYFTELGNFVSKYWNSTTACLKGLWRIDNYEVKSQFLFIFDEVKILNEKKKGEIWSNFEIL